MNFILDGLLSAIKLLISFDKEVYSIAFVSVKITIISTFIATIIGLIVGFLLGLNKFKYKSLIVIFLNTLLAIPTVLIGLLVYAFISRQGILGRFDLLYSQWAIIIGQSILAFPIIASLSLAALESLDKRVKNTLLTLGASRVKMIYFIFIEGRYALLASIIAGFGRVFAEVGISMMLGGNINGVTRTITTAIAFETGKGEFALGVALGLILLFISLIINMGFHFIQRRKFA
ncbi:MAG: ABC transporter permease [Pseudomonadota bacterium]